MTLQETKDIILKWISSCDTAQQLDLLTTVIVSHVVIPFQKIVPELEMIMVREDLINAIADRKLYIIRKSLPSNVPTLDAYLNDERL